MNEQTGEEQNVVRSEMSKSSWWWPTLAAIGLIVSIVTGVRSSNRLGRAERVPQGPLQGSSALMGVYSGVSVDSAEKQAREERRIRAARKAAVDRYRNSVETEYEAFTRRVSERAAVFNVVRAGISPTVEKYGFKKCWSIMYALAKDKIAQTLGKGCTTNFDQLMNEDLRAGFYRPILDARMQVLGVLDEFRIRLQTCQDELTQKLGEIPDWDRSLGELPVSLKVQSLRIEETMAALREAQIGISVSVIVESGCLGKVRNTIARLLALAARRFAAGAMAGAATATADGPLPGPADLIGLGIFGAGAAATLWEVREAVKVIPDQLRKAMHETVDTQCQEVQRRTRDEGEKLYLIHTRNIKRLLESDS